MILFAAMEGKLDRSIRGVTIASLLTATIGGGSFATKVEASYDDASYGLNTTEEIFDSKKRIKNPKAGSEKIVITIPESSPSALPELEIQDPIEFGFNTHLNNEAENMSLEFFKKNVDLLSENNQEWIRFNIYTPELIDSGDATSFSYDGEILNDYVEAVEYANEKGLKIALVTNTPDFANGLERTEYLNITAAFYRDIATRFKGKIDTYQIFNEANVHNFRNYNERPELSDEYLADFAEVVSIASKALKSVDEEARTTVNMSHWIGSGADLIKEGSAFFDSVKVSIDVVTLDLYPDSSVEEIDRFPEYVTYFNNRYQKPVVIGEIGWPTFKNGFSANERVDLMNLSIEAFRGGIVKPESVLFYELTDEKGISENAFGVLEYDGNPDNSFQGVINIMQMPEDIQD